MTEFSLTGEFPPTDVTDWAGLVRRIVGHDTEPDDLGTTTRDGLGISPIYPQRHPGHGIERAQHRWKVFQRVDHPDPAIANEFAREDLAGGADGLEIVFPGSAAAHGFGLGIDCLDDMDRLLTGIDIEAVPLRLDGGYEVRQAIAMAAALVDRRGADPSKIDIVALSDPGNGLFSDGRIVVPYPLASDWGADMVHGLIARGLKLSVYVGEARAVHAAGATEVQELAYALASGVEHIRMLEARGVALEDAAAMVTFTFAADADQFLTMAKLRAFRLAWARIVQLCGLPDATPRIHAETAWRMMTRNDPWTNILRNAVAVAAAGLGGADSILALPFTIARGLPDSFARRIARNSQLVLLEEAGLSEVADPAAGSGYVETTTERLTEAAWELFRQIEAAGGIIDDLRSGRFQEAVLEARRRRELDAAMRVEPIVGITEYAWLGERAVQTLAAEPYQVHPSGDPIPLPPAGKGTRFEGLVAAVCEGATMADILASIGYEWERAPRAPWRRLSEPFERLRDAGEEASRVNGRFPTVFLANLGDAASHASRSNWIQDLLAAGGIAVLSGTPETDPDAIATAFVESGLKVVCICASDAEISKNGARLAEMLVAEGARHILIAGPPGTNETELRTAGVDVFLHDGCDILVKLENMHTQIGEADLRQS
jgi:methylmalonyl-CoA mutase